MKLEVGRFYHTRNPKIDNIGPAKIVSKEEYRRIFGYPADEDYMNPPRPFIAVYGLKTGKRPTYAKLYENGRGSLEEENFYDAVRPMGNILNK